MKYRADVFNNNSILILNEAIVGILTKHFKNNIKTLKVSWENCVNIILPASALKEHRDFLQKYKCIRQAPSVHLSACRCF